jgi:hypothetical protein
VFLLHKIRKKDWNKHWEEMAAEHKMHEELEARRRSAAADAKKGNTDGN